jgi:DNA-directed RNA polymerase specialized sigma24 family protein
MEPTLSVLLDAGTVLVSASWIFDDSDGTEVALENLSWLDQQRVAAARNTLARLQSEAVDPDEAYRTALSEQVLGNYHDSAAKRAYLERAYHSACVSVEDATLELYEAGEFSRTELAGMLTVSKHTIDTRIQRARARRDGVSPPPRDRGGRTRKAKLNETDEVAPAAQ